MSRSYKKGYRKPKSKGAVYHKRQANKKVRRTRNLGDYAHYKKVYCSWNIRDYSSYIILMKREDFSWTNIKTGETYDWWSDSKFLEKNGRIYGRA